MKFLDFRLLLAGLIVSTSAALGVNEPAAKDIAACVSDAVSELRASKGKPFVSEQFRVICKPGRKTDGSVAPDCEDQARDEHYVYTAPEGFLIGAARFDVVIKTRRTEIDDLVVTERKATIGLHCHSACGEQGHVMAGGNVKGRLDYIPTASERAEIEARCAAADG